MDAKDIIDNLMTPLRKPVILDEGVLRTAIARGDAAQQLKENEVFDSLLTEVEDYYMHAWKSSTADSVEVREKCHVACKIVEDIRNVLTSRVRNGEAAAENLRKQKLRQSKVRFSD